MADPSNPARPGTPSGVPKRYASPVSASAAISQAPPAAASPARRHGVGASAASPTKAGPRPIVPSSGAITGSDQSSPARGRHRGTASMAAATSRAVPGRSAAVASHAQTTRPEAAHPTRGRRAVATAAAAPKVRGDWGASVPSVPSAAATMRPGGHAGEHSRRHPAGQWRTLPERTAPPAEHPEPGGGVGVQVLGQRGERRHVAAVERGIPAAAEAAAAASRGDAHALQRGRLLEPALLVQLALGLDQSRPELRRARAAPPDPRPARRPRGRRARAEGRGAGRRAGGAGCRACAQWRPGRPRARDWSPSRPRRG